MTRRDIIDGILFRARAESRIVYWLDGPRPTEVRKGVVPPNAVYICVSGDTAWTTLPKDDDK